jgi:hypothetical protein
MYSWSHPAARRLPFMPTLSVWLFFEHTQCGAAEDAEVSIGVSLANPRVVFAKCHVELPVQAILDRPVAADGLPKLLGRELPAQDVVSRFAGRLLAKILGELHQPVAFLRLNRDPLRQLGPQDLVLDLEEFDLPGQFCVAPAITGRNDRKRLVIEVKCASRYGSWRCAHFGTPEGASLTYDNRRSLSKLTRSFEYSQSC